MSRKKTQAELEEEALRADREASDLARKQDECGHWNCSVTEWWWSGRVRELTCNECGKTKFLEDLPGEVQ